MTDRRGVALLGCVLMACVVSFGCLSDRQEAVLNRQPGNPPFKPQRLAALGEGETHSFGEYDRGFSQNVCVLQLAPTAALKTRYHAEHDLVLVVVAGRAIVTVEGTRRVVQPGSAVILPRYTAYSVTPKGPPEGEAEAEPEEFVALMVYSPPFEGEDVVVEQ